MKDRKGERGVGALIAVLITLAILMTIAAMAAPVMLEVQQHQNEQQAIGNLQTIAAAEESYMGLFHSYPTQFSYLSVCHFPADSTGACLLAPPLTSGATFDGYTITAPVSTSSLYTVHAVPKATTTGRMQFCVSNTPGAMDGFVRGQIGQNNTLTLAQCELSQIIANNAQGPPGPAGPANAISTTFAAQTVASGATVSLGSVSLPTGSYVITASVGGALPSAGTATGFVVCSLVDSQGTLVFGVPTNKGFVSGTTNVWPGTSLAAQLTVTSTDTLSLQCQPSLNISIGPSVISVVKATKLSLS